MRIERYLNCKTDDRCKFAHFCGFHHYSQTKLYQQHTPQTIQTLWKSLFSMRIWINRPMENITSTRTHILIKSHVFFMLLCVIGLDGLFDVCVVFFICLKACHMTWWVKSFTVFPLYPKRFDYCRNKTVKNKEKIWYLNLNDDENRCIHCARIWTRTKYRKKKKSKQLTDLDNSAHT